MTATNAVPVDPSNAEQLRAWDGDEGAYWAAQRRPLRPVALAATTDGSSPRPRIGEHDRVLDIGCGTGQTTRDAARAATAGSALGVDLSSRDARRTPGAAPPTRASTNVSFEQADAQIHPFEPGAFDVAISRTGAMFFGDLVAALRQHRPGAAPGRPPGAR